MLDRAVFGYVVSIDGPAVILNLRSEHRGFVASHRQGISGLLENGSLFGVSSGSSILVLRVLSLQFAEPKEVHLHLREAAADRDEPLRNLKAICVGRLSKKSKALQFDGDALASPALGAEAFPLTDMEQRAIHCLPEDSSPQISLGTTLRGSGSLDVTLNQLLPRHIAVLGGTGQGKSCFTAAMLQQMLPCDSARIVVFDINGEYERALRPFCKEGEFKITRLGGDPDNDGYRLPYFALGRAGLSRLLLPSERTQRPALNFALESLPYVEHSDGGACLTGEEEACLFDDCRPGKENEAARTIESLRNPSELDRAEIWPPMAALSCLIADSQCLRKNNQQRWERQSFHYSNVAPLIDRVRRKIDDPMFTQVVNVEGGDRVRGSWGSHSTSLVKRFFGSPRSTWKVHVVDLRLVTHDLLPGVLGSLLELFAYDLFRKGQDATYPTLLVLEEAHHYLRSVTLEDGSTADALAYERLAKEGRKFNLSLWISTQRPSEVSSTVLSQCGTWACFRLTGQSDVQAVGTATEWLDRREISAISGLPRQQALVFGSAIPLPTRVRIPNANPTPKSNDPQFERWNVKAGENP
ncbi:ATP-binding protein [Stieleria sp. TO1_6]|uniref:ATP-binding protein n=1 Tax=Stieleria tagensis TaxID=2956795 RepID=UPI00209AA702|nr:ATP-binding protein [Stieleria tagensis]MCO8123317.1 ATP-binding protein [Stieleria tagensis]